MTLLLGDYALWQGSLRPADFQRAGFAGINFKTSHGLGVKSVHPQLVPAVTETRAAGMLLSSFHYLTGEASGKAQAEHAYARLVEAGLQHNSVHQVDCEADATWQILSDYVTTMRTLLGRPVAIYSADWWWVQRGWPGSQLSPYVWAAPDSGYTVGYPGDNSPLWACSWGGWATMAILQYEVGALRYPDGTTSGTIKVSKSAIRDLSAWAALAGGQMTAPVCTDVDLEQYAGEATDDPWLSPRGWPEPSEFRGWLPELPGIMPLARTTARASAWIVVPALNALLAELNEVAPNRDETSDGSIGDQSHASGSSGHNPDETGNPEDQDLDRINEVRARDFDKDLRRAGLTMEMVIQYLVQECRAGRVKWIKYIIFNKRIWAASTNFVTRVYTGANAHSEHAHVSCKPDTISENTTRKVGLASLLEEDDMNAAEMTAWAKSAAGREALARAVLTYDPGKDAAGNVKPGGVINPDANAATNPTIGPAWALNRAAVAAQLGYQNRDRLDTLTQVVSKIATNVVEDDGDLAAIQAALAELPQQTVDLLGQGGSLEEKARLIASILGPDAPAVGRLLQAQGPV